MTSTPPNHNEPTSESLLPLIDDLIQGSISEADHASITRALSSSGELREQYLARVELDWMLEQEAELSMIQQVASHAIASNLEPEASNADHALVTTGKTVNRTHGVLAGFLIGIAASIITWLATPLSNPPSNQNTLDPSNMNSGSTERFANLSEPSASGFAVLRSAHRAHWEQKDYAAGDLISNGPNHLKYGVIQLELFSGVQITMEGEALFTIDSPMHLTMNRGKANVFVPEPAKGFTVETSSGEVIDLGTEFAIDVSKQQADVRVIDGEVEIRPLDRPQERLTTGQTFRLQQNQAQDTNPTLDVDVTNGQNLSLQQSERLQRRLREHLEARQKQLEDARLVAFYHLAPSSGQHRAITNLAIAPRADSNAVFNASDGAIVAANPSVDRWGRPGQALDFGPLGSRIRVKTSGTLTGITLNCWVRINSLDRWYNSLFLTDGHEEREPHWQIMDDGRIFFSVKTPNSKDSKNRTSQHVFYSPSIWDKTKTGRWMMLSVSYDPAQKQVTHFLNGKAISNEKIPEFAIVDTINIGDASICNWNDPSYRSDAKFVVRNLNGCMDEFAIYSAPLTPNEIQSLYQSGNPNDL
ncbi:MAG: LamG-like jellyroll fold domain-containing protein [Rubripirellula sp.]